MLSFTVNAVLAQKSKSGKKFRFVKPLPTLLNPPTSFTSPVSPSYPTPPTRKLCSDGDQILIAKNVTIELTLAWRRRRLDKIIHRSVAWLFSR